MFFQYAFLMCMFTLYSSLFSEPWKLFHTITDGGMSALTFILFTQKFFISSCRILVWRIIFRFCRTDCFGDHLWFPFHLSTAKSTVIIFICLYLVALEYFPYDLIFAISRKLVPCILIQILPVYWYFQRTFLRCFCHSQLSFYAKNMIYKIASLVLYF